MNPTLVVLGMLGIILTVCIGIILQGLRKIKADPPHVGLVTYLGEKQNKIKKEGWRFFLFYSWLYGFIPINVRNVNHDIPAEKVRTPDRAEVGIPISVTFAPDTSTELKEGETVIPLINYVKHGKEKVLKVLVAIIAERVREWALSPNEGPRTWMDAMASSEEATNVLLKAIVGDAIHQIPSSVPTPILLRALSSPPQKPTDSQKEDGWGEKWEEVEKRIKEDSNNPEYNTDPASIGDVEKYRIFLKSKIEERRREIAGARQGNGFYRIRQLGIILMRLNVGEITPLGKVAEAAENQAKEAQERAGETLELTHLQERLAELMKPRDQKGGLGMTLEQALEAFQTERDKVKKTITETKFSVSPETRGTVEKIAAETRGTVENIATAVISALARKEVK